MSQVTNLYDFWYITELLWNLVYLAIDKVLIHSVIVNMR
jgi:hypothetical protein